MGQREEDEGAGSLGGPREKELSDETEERDSFNEQGVGHLVSRGPGDTYVAVTKETPYQTYESGVEKNLIMFYTELCFNLSEAQSESVCRNQVSHSHLDL